MKLLSAIILTLALAVFAIAQRAQNNTDEKLMARNAPDVFIFGASAFGPDKNGDSNLTIEIGNMGPRTITGVEWEYDPSRDGAVYDSRGRSIFRDDTSKLFPDQRIKLTQRVHHYTDSFIKSFHLGTVRILRVEYDDGTSWRRPANQ